MTTDGGGWIVIQRRYDGSVNFTQTFHEYTEGFGSVSGEYWLGLQWMHVLSSQGDTPPVQLRIDLCAFNGDVGYAKYNVFLIARQHNTYRLIIGGFTGDGLYDWLGYQSGMTFKATGRGAYRNRGGWWNYDDGSYNVNLNGGIYNGDNGQGIVWYRFGRALMSSLRSSEMKIRPVCVTGASSQPYMCPS